MDKVRLKIFRFDSSFDRKPKYKIYEFQIEEETTLQTTLNWIQENLDPTLAIRDYSCGAGPLCGGCLVAVNGKATFSCCKVLKGGEELTIEPLRGYPIIKDLVVDYGSESSFSTGKNGKSYEELSKENERK